MHRFFPLLRDAFESRLQCGKAPHVDRQRHCGELTLTRMEVALPTATAATLAEYVAWVQRCSDKTAHDATTATVDFALREVFRRDRLWRDERRIPERTPAAKPPTAPGSTLPPPGGTPRDPRPS